MRHVKSLTKAPATALNAPDIIGGIRTILGLWKGPLFPLSRYTRTPQGDIEDIR